MKKTKLFGVILTLVLALALCFGLTACGVAGTYKLEELSVTVNGEVLTAKAGEDLVVVEKIGETTSTMTYPVSEKDCVFTFKSNGTYSIRMYLPVFERGGGSTLDIHEEGTWEEQDGKINVTDSDGETDSFTIDGKRIIIDMGIYKIVLKK